MSIEVMSDWTAGVLSPNSESCTCEACPCSCPSGGATSNLEWKNDNKQTANDFAQEQLGVDVNII